MPQQAVVVSDVVGQRGGAYRATALLSEALCDLGLQTTTFVRWVEPDFELSRKRWLLVKPLIKRGSRLALPERILVRQAARYITCQQPVMTIVVGLTSLCARLLSLSPPKSLWVWELTNAENGNKFVDPEAVRQLDRVRGLLSPAKAIDDAVRTNYRYSGPIERLSFWIEPGPDCYQPPPGAFSCDFLFLSRREDDKGLADLIRATAIVGATEANFLVLVAGAGNEEKYQKLAEQLQVNDLVKFISLASRTDAMDKLSHARYVVLPSHHEGFPISILEGTQRSVPFITTPVGAIPEMLGYGQACYYHSPGDVTALADRMLRALRESNAEYCLRRKCAFEAYAKILDVESPTHRLKQLLTHVTTNR